MRNNYIRGPKAANRAVSLSWGHESDLPYCGKDESIRDLAPRFCLSPKYERDLKILVATVEGKTLASLGEGLCLSRERVRQLQSRIIKRLKAHLGRYCPAWQSFASWLEEHTGSVGFISSSLLMERLGVVMLGELPANFDEVCVLLGAALPKASFREVDSVVTAQP